MTAKPVDENKTVVSSIFKDLISSKAGMSKIIKDVNASKVKMSDHIPPATPKK